MSAVKYASFVFGNSSSGIVEAPILGVPTINIGNRQRGRIMAETIINVPFDKQQIIEAIKQARQTARVPSTLYGDGNTSIKMVDIMKRFLDKDIDLKKGFYDLPV